MKAPIPIIRIFDENLARGFYVDFLGFQIDWEHRFSEGMPLYMQIARGACVIHLSEHSEDATPGSSIRIEVEDIGAHCAQLRAANSPHCKPGKPRDMPWGLTEIRIADPFGNHLIFYQTTAEAAQA